MKLPLRIKIFIAAVISAAGIIIWIIFRLNNNMPIDWLALLFWASLAVLTESLVLRLPSGMGLSVTLAILLAALLSKGILVAVIATMIAFLMRVIKVEGKNKFSHFFNTIPYKSFFNAAQSVVAIGISGIVYHILGGASGTFSVFLTIQIVFTFTFINSVIMSFFFALMRRQPFFRVWLSNMRGIIINVLMVGIMGIILFLAFDSYGYGAVLLFLGPLLLARFSFKQYSDLRETYLETIKAFNELTEAKDAYTGEHSSRVEIYAVAMAEHIKLTDQKINNIRMAAILHDIGKIGIDDNIIKKPAGLTDPEYEMIKRHPVIGADIIQKVNFLRDVSKIIRHHHERFDGRGYPDALKGDQISKESAILSLADVYDAITSKRPYRPARGFEEAKKEILANSGTQFDPELAKAFVDLMEKRKEVFYRDAD